MINSSKFVLVLLGGVAAGTVFGILIAPDEGRESRQLLRKTVEDLRFSVKKRVADEFYHLSRWNARIVNAVKAQLFGPEPDMPDDLEHG